MSNDPPFHGSGAPEAEDRGPEPTLAERARTLVELGGHSTLATVSRKHEGHPFGSLMPYGLDDDGSPLFLISSMAMHTQNLQRDPRCTLLIVQPAGDGEALGAGRISIMGEASIAEENQASRLKELYLQRNPSAQSWINYGDFALYRLSVLDVYFVGGFGVMGWLTAAEYRAAQPDPLAHAADEIMQHMNADHTDAMIALARHFGGVDATEALMTGIDYLGFDMRLVTQTGYKSLRIAFDEPLSDAGSSRAALIGLVNQARR